MVLEKKTSKSAHIYVQTAVLELVAGDGEFARSVFSEYFIEFID